MLSSYGSIINVIIIVIVIILIVKRRNRKIRREEEKKVREAVESCKQKNVAQNASVRREVEFEFGTDHWWEDEADGKKIEEIDETDDMSKYSYRARKHMMTNAEERCFHILEETFSQKFYIFPQVHLSKILDHKIKGQNYYGAFQHINGKSVDFVLVRKTNMELVCGVELDDYTHNYRSRQKRDTEVERMFRQAGFPLVRITEPQRISRKEMIEIFRKKIVETGK